MNQLNKSFNHDHFFIQGCELFESYRTLRGMRFKFLCEVLWPDTERLTDSEIETINKILNGIES